MGQNQSLPKRRISSDIARQLRDDLGQNVYLCYQCVKCSSGCPVAEFFDWQPNQIMRAVQLGQADILWESKTPWLCASCQTCTTRCPQGLDIAAIMDYITRQAVVTGHEPTVPQVNVFTQAFMREVRLWGRAYELGLMAEVKLRNHDLTSDLDLGMKMLKKRKFPLLPSPTHMPRNVTIKAKSAHALAYYPGCSLHSTAKEFDVSTRAVCRELGMELVEPDGWICCGSSAAHRSDPATATRLPMENLALIEKNGLKEVVMPCAACYNRHQTALHTIRHNPQDREAAEQAIEYNYRDSVQVTNLPQAIMKNVGVEKITARTTRPLHGLKAVAYYGCLLTRPPEVTGAEHPDNPSDIDGILKALGAEVLDWSYKTSCCGASHSLTRPDIVLKLSGRLITEAQRAGADVIAVACPLCHTNLDARQFQMHLEKPTPVLYLTQLMALAFDLPAKASALQYNLVDPLPLLNEKGLAPPPA